MTSPYLRQALFAEYRTSARYVFLPAEAKGRYVRTHPSAAFVACPDCNSQPGEPCTILRPEGYEPNTWRYYSAEVHRKRKDVYHQLRKEAKE